VVKTATQLVVNADDCGLTPALNRGIYTAIEEGIVTSVSLVANGTDFKNAVQFLRRHPHISVGWHINLTAGEPLCGKAVPSLIGKDEGFLGKSRFIRRLYRNCISAREVRNECLSQLHKIQDTGLAISHVDSHHDIHCTHHIAKILLPVIKSYGLKKLRFAGTKIQILKERTRPFTFFNHLCYRYGAALYATAYDLASSHYYWGIELFHGKQKIQIIDDYLHRMNAGIHLLVTHPGFNDLSSRGTHAHRLEREQECQALCHPMIKELVKETVTLVSFNSLLCTR
jgi:chitin disaccharide deacetylase